MSQRSSQKLGGKEKRKSHNPAPSSTAGPSRLLEQTEMDTTDSTASQVPSSSMSRKCYDQMKPSVQAEKVAAMVRYFLCYHGKKTVLKRKELLDKVLGEHKRAFPEIFEEANKQLQEVFGLKVVEIYRGNATSTKSYVLVSVLPMKHTCQLVQRSKADKTEMGLLCIILSLIMMKQGGLSEDQLWNCLNRLDIDTDHTHSTFGDVKKLINVEFVSQMYLDKEKVVTGDKHAITFRWGPRAEAEVDKNEMLSFVADIYEADFDQWKRQFVELLK